MKQNVVGSLFAIALVIGALALAATLPTSKIGALGGALPSLAMFQLNSGNLPQSPKTGFLPVFILSKKKGNE